MWGWRDGSVGRPLAALAWGTDLVQVLHGGRGPSTLFWSMEAPGKCTVHIIHAASHSHTWNKNDKS